MLFVHVQFTDEEKKVIQLAKLKDHIICERPKRAGQKASASLDDIWHLRVRHLLEDKPNEYEFENLAEANSYNDALVPSLRNLKAAIEANSKPIENTSIEL